MAQNVTGVTNDTSATSDLDGIEVRARVVKAHESHDENQLSLEVGEMVWVLEQDESGWWGGHKEGEDRTAWFPGTCVVVVQEQIDSPRMASRDHVETVAMESPRRRVAMERQVQQTVGAATSALAKEQPEPQASEIEKLKLELCTLRERCQNARDQLARSEEDNKELKAELQSCRDDARSDRARAAEYEKRLQECRLEVKRLEKDLQREKDSHAQRENDSRIRHQQLEVRIRESENDAEVRIRESENECRRVQEQLRFSQERNETLVQELQARATTHQPQQPQPRRRLFGSQADSRTSDLVVASPAPSESPAQSPSATPVRSQTCLAPPFFCGGAKRPPAQRPASLGPASRGQSASQAHFKQDLPRGMLCTSRSAGDLSPKPDLEAADQEASVASKIASFEQRTSRRSGTPSRSACPSPARSHSTAAWPSALHPVEQNSAAPPPLDVDDDDELQVVLGMSPLNHRGRRTSQASSQCPGSSSKQCFDLGDRRESTIPEGSVKHRIRIFSNQGGS